MCIYFIYKWRYQQFKVDSDLQIFFEELSIAILFTLREFARKLLRNNQLKGGKWYTQFNRRRLLKECVLASPPVSQNVTVPG